MSPRPTAAPRCWPYPNHGTIAERDRDQAAGCDCELVRERSHAADCGLLARLNAERGR